MKFSANIAVERDLMPFSPTMKKSLNSIENANFFHGVPGCGMAIRFGGGELDGAAYQRKTENISIVSSK